MSEEKKEGGESNAEDFNLQAELAKSVANNVIPKVIAEKLEKKLVEKEVNITKNQLLILTNKIHDLIQTYKQTGSLPENNIPTAQSTELPSISNEKTDIKAVKEEPKEDAEIKSDEEMDTETVEEFMNKIKELHQKIDMLEQETQTKNSSEENQYVQNKDDELKIPYDDSISTDHLTRDPLQSIPPDPESIIVLMNWIQYLVNRCGHDNLIKVLDYYVEVDWITDDVKISLLEYATGVSEGGKKNIQTELSSKGKVRKTPYLHSKDHIQSYLYIQRLKGKKFEKHFVERINGELARIEKKVDTYHHTL